MNDKISNLIKFINESNNIVFFGGAGVSTESGIPDFRSKDGLYNQHDIQFDQYDPEYLLSKECLCHNPKVFYEFYRHKLDARDIEPNITHKVLAKLEDMGKLKAIVTQNIDGLHQKAGSKNVYEIHGTTQRNYCIKCGKEYPSDYIFNSTESIPICDCKRMIRPDVVLYGEGLPVQTVNEAVLHIKQADLLIIAGTSLKVYPTANFINYFRGDHLVVINKEEIKLPMDPENDLIITDSLGNVFNKINDMLEAGEYDGNE